MDVKKERLTTIIDILKVHNAATIKDLADRLQVSEMTMRRDLAQLADDNIVKLIHGGVIFNRTGLDTAALLTETDAGTYYLSSEENRRVEEKRKIAEKAASLIKPEDVVIIDSGSTTEFIGEYLPANMPVTIICFSVNILLSVYSRRNCRIIFAGGYFHENALMFESPEGVELIRRNRAAKAFLSARGVSAELGITSALPYEIEMKRAAMGSSLEKILLVDSSKFDRVCPAHFANLADLNAIVTDGGIPQNYRKLCGKYGIRLYLV
ncbi:MAG: DeoR/GlpR transcriptional regulator [Spirochaetales bacterium]|nr:MAG: DeoR/GlpR transcriptional regulator [Spirochaetales bacterium]